MIPNPPEIDALSTLPVRLFAVRGAILLPGNTPQSIQDSTLALMQALIDANQITPQACVTVWFGLTSDITAENPARAFRNGVLRGSHLNLSSAWQDVALFCLQEPSIDGFPELCLRVLIQYYQAPEHTPTPAYCNGAQERLRPDRLPPAV